MASDFDKRETPRLVEPCERWRADAQQIAGFGFGQELSRHDASFWLKPGGEPELSASAQVRPRPARQGMVLLLVKLKRSC